MDEMRLLVLVTTLGIARETKGANALADNLEKQFPADTLVRRVWVPTARAAVEIARGNPAKAIDLLQSAKPYELGRMTRMFGSPTPTYVRGEAYLASRAVRRSRVRVSKHSRSSGRGCGKPCLCPGARRAGAGPQPQRAIRRRRQQVYQDFFALWSDADPDIPLLQEARQEYAKLQAGTPRPRQRAPAEPQASQLRGDPRTRGETRAAASFLMNPRSDPRIAPAHRREAGAH